MKRFLIRFISSYIAKVTASGIATADVNAVRFIQDSKDEELTKLTSKWYFVS